ncbi:histidine decarboxylase [Fischerella thermalis]|uniref:histidine decarboxylase n=1 Tax=Fischerella thermalis TaxID=372787 RepID=UPI000C80E1DA|nr:histidine decarboxylase [Fischerella thermalis]PLZ06795.1 histidine decarboxylase [Fischerella thermalis WC119]PLZ08132.1 histidine decarboxylase [Fischerella thermalis WC114]PLZ08959.1 histidine decarboxylase [Fischerella thermalis WC1110]PLZ19619.1 histidine decarboxylase [Fischerella thermalis WC341]PLZ19901.1 histidine decarboxylase [Fischerella thermalis WC157]
MFPQLVDTNTSISLKLLQQHIAECAKLSIGYPVNLDFDYTLLLPFLQYNLNNVGDPFVEGNFALHSKEFERQSLNWFAQLYELEEYWGYLTSGGTEGNLYGMFLGRELYPDAVLYSSRDTHYSVAKAARLLKIPHVVICSQFNGEINYEHLEYELSQRKQQSAIININLGTTMKGAVDNIERINDIIQRLRIRFYIHCDGALGGMLLPFIQEAPKISFRDYPIGSISVSGHKFIGSPITYGIVLTRQPYVKKIETSVEYIGSKDMTILGSRSGLAALLLWYAIQTRNQQFHKEVATCLQNARYLRDRLLEINYHPLLNDFSTTVVFDKPAIELCRKWQLATQGNIAHIVVMQHISTQKIDQFIDNLLVNNQLSCFSTSCL